ncbi:phosphohistidine phosphatase SixA [Candidatus Pelagibacter sp.]|uniref:phosphohistidine phosphatase SixA n=1 Tax=Candidatus Pelagibacter sp. TaxID=2024849 RepID=UPI003F87F07F
MLELYVMRHAKSSWDNLQLPDHDRPLSDRGKRNAKKICEFFVKKQIKFDLVLVSSSIRTKKTLKILQKKLEKPKKIITSKSLYLANENKIALKIKKIKKDYKKVLLINHEPAVTNLVNYLVKNKENSLFKLMNYKFSTAAFAKIVFDLDNWSKINDRTGLLKNFIRPKDI